MRRYVEGRLTSNEEVYTSTQREASAPELGYGTHIDQNGVRYEGEFVNYKRHGKGTVTYPNGDREVGEWSSGLKEGRAMRKTSAGEFFYEEWKYGELLSSYQSDELNWLNFFWYDEGGFASHN